MEDAYQAASRLSLDIRVSDTLRARRPLEVSDRRAKKRNSRAVSAGMPLLGVALCVREQRFEIFPADIEAFMHVLEGGIDILQFYVVLDADPHRRLCG